MKNRAIRKLLVVVLFIYAMISPQCFAQNGLVAHWNFEDYGNIKTTDIIGGLYAFLFGAELVAEPAPRGGSYALTCDSGKPGGSGSSNIAFSINVNSFSVSAWAKTTGTSGDRIITVSPSGGTGQGYWLDITNGGLFGIQIGVGTPLQIWGNTGISLEDGEYHYLVGVHDAVNRKIHVYVDGVLTASSSTAGLSGAVGYDFSFCGVGGSPIFRGYIDDVKIFNRALSGSEILQEFNPSFSNPPIPLQEALDNNVLLWGSSGSKDWFGQKATTYDQVDAAQSGDITDQQVSSLETTVSGPGNVSFYWKVSSEEKYDFLKFYIDEVEQSGISGEVDWEQRSFSVPSGQHILKWNYSKDCCSSSGSDVGFIDKVVFKNDTPNQDMRSSIISKIIPLLLEDSFNINAAKKAIAMDLVNDYGGDIGTISAVANFADYAILSWAAYDDDEALNFARSIGWEKDRIIHRDNGLAPDTNATLFTNTYCGIRQANPAYVLAFRGTSKGYDWYTNTLGTVSIDPDSLSVEQVEGAIDIANEIEALHNNVVFVGHSLGGRLAQAARLETGNAAVVFNSAPIGAYEYLQETVKLIVDALFNNAPELAGLYKFRGPDDFLTEITSSDDIVVENIVNLPEKDLLDKLNINAFISNQKDYAHSMKVLASAMYYVRVAMNEGWIESYLGLPTNYWIEPEHWEIGPNGIICH